MFAIRRVGQQALKAGVRHSSAVSGGHGGGSEFWKKLLFFGGLPAIGLAMVNIYLNHEHGERAEFIPYEYLRIRNKRFPWGDGNHTLFHNPAVNALPDGYETEEPSHH